MQKIILLLSSFSTIIVLTIGLSSCKDDEPFVKPNLSVASATLTVGEAAGTLQVEVILDKGAPQDITIEYGLGGSALSPADYTVVGNEGEVDIAKGATSGIIQLQIVSDAIYEGDETIEISLQDVNSDDVVITNNDEVDVTITDDDPQLNVSFPTATLTVSESDNTALLEIEVVLSGAAPQAVTVGYTLAHGAGKAIDDVYAKAQTPQAIPSQYYDFLIQGGQLQVVIAQGATTGKIQFQLLSDFHFEDDETIEITLASASNGVQISANNKKTITLEQENGKIVALVWDDTYTDVDMDLFLWIGDVVTDLGFAASSTNPDVDPQVELLFIPDVVDAAYGVSYTYYGGTASPMNFEAQFIDFTDGTVEAQADYDIYPGTYTLVNINKWDTDAGIDPVIAQTFVADNGQITGITDPIVAPAAGSRMVTVALPNGVRKMKTAHVSIN